MSNLFNFLISKPLYNGLIALLGLLPSLDAGVIIIIFTIIVKIILLPLSIKATKSQIQMKSTEKDLAVIKEKYKDDKNTQSIKTMEYYKEKGINPFSGFFILLIQLPILIGIYRVFIKAGLPDINQEMLYPLVSSLVSSLPTINMVFLNLINISEKSIFLAVISGVTAYFQFSLANSTIAPSEEGSTQNDIARAMSFQMKYFFPILIGFVSYSISSAIALYIITSNVFAIGQEYYIKKKYHKSAIVV